MLLISKDSESTSKSLLVGMDFEFSSPAVLLESSMGRSTVQCALDPNCGGWALLRIPALDRFWCNDAFAWRPADFCSPVPFPFWK